MRRSWPIGAVLAAGFLLLAACADPETTPESAENRISASEDDATFEPSEGDADPESTSSGTIVTDIGQDDAPPIDDPAAEAGEAAESAADTGAASPATDTAIETGAAQPSDTDGPATSAPATATSPGSAADGSSDSTAGTSTGTDTGTTGTGSSPGSNPNPERNPDPEQRTDDAVMVLADAGPPPEDSAAPPAIDADVDTDDTPGAETDVRLALDQGSALACAVLEIGRDAVADGDTNRAVVLAERLDENRDRIGDTRIRAVITELAAADRADTDLLDDGLTRCVDLGYETSV